MRRIDARESVRGDVTGRRSEILQVFIVHFVRIE